MDKPLHVQVAEALGNETRPVPLGIGWQIAQPLEEHGIIQWVPVPRYDTDWNATGPLIDKYRISLFANDGYCRNDGCGEGNCCNDSCPCWELATWSASTTENDGVNDVDPLIAVCNLLLVLNGAGKLESHALAPVPLTD